MESLGIMKVKEELDASVAEARKKKAMYRGIMREKKIEEPWVWPPMLSSPIAYAPNSTCAL